MLRRSCISVLGIELNDDYFDISLLRIIDVVDHDLAIDPVESSDLDVVKSICVVITG